MASNDFPEKGGFIPPHLARKKPDCENKPVLPDPCEVRPGKKKFFDDSKCGSTADYLTCPSDIGVTSTNKLVVSKEVPPQEPIIIAREAPIPDIPAPPTIPPAPDLFPNIAITDTCPEGLAGYEVHVPAGSFYAVTQSEADALAEAEVARLRALRPCGKGNAELKMSCWDLLSESDIAYLENLRVVEPRMCVMDPDEYTYDYNNLIVGKEVVVEADTFIADDQAGADTSALAKMMEVLQDVCKLCNPCMHKTCATNEVPAEGFYAEEGMFQSQMVSQDNVPVMEGILENSNEYLNNFECVGWTIVPFNDLDLGCVSIRTCLDVVNPNADRFMSYHPAGDPTQYPGMGTNTSGPTSDCCAGWPAGCCQVVPLAIPSIPMMGGGGCPEGINIKGKIFGKEFETRKSGIVFIGDDCTPCKGIDAVGFDNTFNGTISRWTRLLALAEGDMVYYEEWTAAGQLSGKVKFFLVKQAVDPNTKKVEPTLSPGWQDYYQEFKPHCLPGLENIGDDKLTPGWGVMCHPESDPASNDEDDKDPCAIILPDIGFNDFCEEYVFHSWYTNPNNTGSNLAQEADFSQADVLTVLRGTTGTIDLRNFEGDEYFFSLKHNDVVYDISSEDTQAPVEYPVVKLDLLTASGVEHTSYSQYQVLDKGNCLRVDLAEATGLLGERPAELSITVRNDNPHSDTGDFETIASSTAFSVTVFYYLDAACNVFGCFEFCDVCDELEDFGADPENSISIFQGTESTDGGETETPKKIGEVKVVKKEKSRNSNGSITSCGYIATGNDIILQDTCNPVIDNDDDSVKFYRNSNSTTPLGEINISGLYDPVTGACDPLSISPADIYLDLPEVNDFSGFEPHCITLCTTEGEKKYTILAKEGWDPACESD